MCGCIFWVIGRAIISTLTHCLPLRCMPVKVNRGKTTTTTTTTTKERKMEKENENKEVEACAFAGAIN